MELRFYDDPGEFLDVSGAYLAEQPVLSTVISGVASRLRDQRAAGVRWPDDVPCWFAAYVDGGSVVATAMRTAPFGQYPAYLMPMSDDAAVLLARTLLDRDEPVLGANGSLPAVQVFCEEMAKGLGRTVEVERHTRLFELGLLQEPAEVPGRLRHARLEEQRLVASWYDAFMDDADEQAGRAPGSSAHEAPEPDEMRRRIETGQISVWEVDGVPVHVTAASEPAFGVSRVGPVYTPREHRGHGYASRAVYEVSQHLVENGVRACLFTDQANPTSNKIYEALGYERLVDMANLRVE
jgi:GNAT superfamily N-acetyltransferase